MQRWTILDRTGAVVEPSAKTASFGQKPASAGIVVPAGGSAVAISAEPDSNAQTWNGTAWVDDPTKVEPALITKVKADNEARVRGLYSTNFGKQKKYSRKQQEVLDYRALPGTLGTTVSNALTASLTSFVPGFAALTAAQQAKKFRFAMAEAKIRGVTVPDVITGWETAIDVKEQQVANWEAVEMKAIADIKAATTVAAKRAVYAAIDWSQS